MLKPRHSTSSFNFSSPLVQVPLVMLNISENCGQGWGHVVTQLFSTSKYDGVQLLASSDSMLVWHNGSWNPTHLRSVTWLSFCIQSSPTHPEGTRFWGACSQKKSRSRGFSSFMAPIYVFI